MFCVQESEDPLGGDPFASSEKDPFGEVPSAISESSDEEEPPTKRPHMSLDPGLNLKVYQIPVFDQDTYKNNPYSKPIYNKTISPVIPHSNKRHSAPEPISNEEIPKLPYYDLNPVRYKKNGEIAKKRGPPKGYKRKPKIDPVSQQILNQNPSLTITPSISISTDHQQHLINNTSSSLTITNVTQPTRHPNSLLKPGLTVPNVKGLSITPVNPPMHSLNMNPLTYAAAFNNSSSNDMSNPLLFVSKMLSNMGQLTPSQKNNILSGLLMKNAMEMTKNVDMSELLRQMGMFQQPNFSIIPQQTVTPKGPRSEKIIVPKGHEHIQLEVDPADYFPEEPYYMSWHRKRDPKWKEYPYQCEHCFKGYRVASSLVSHCAERHGSVPKLLAIPCPCCPFVSVRKKQHRKHLEEHSVRRGKLFCQYCVPPQDPTEEYKPVPQRFPYDKYSQYYYASEESLRLHKKRKHPYAAMFNYNWFCTWGES